MHRLRLSPLKYWKIHEIVYKTYLNNLTYALTSFIKYELRSFCLEYTIFATTFSLHDVKKRINDNVVASRLQSRLQSLSVSKY